MVAKSSAASEEHDDNDDDDDDNDDDDDDDDDGDGDGDHAPNMPSGMSRRLPESPPTPESEPEIVEIEPPPGMRFPPASRPQEEERLREAVLALDKPDMDAESVVLIVAYLQRYFAPRAGRKPSPLELEVSRTLLANPRVDEELRVVLRAFYNVLWIPTTCE
jgi:hypothetical protein